MRFAWLRKNLADYVSVKQAYTHPFVLIRLAYNAVFWIFLLPFFTIMDYNTAFVTFTIVIFIRLALNLYTNMVLKTPEQFERFPFRIFETFEGN